MARYIYPTEKDLRVFLAVLREGDYSVSKYLPATSETWFKQVSELVTYVADTEGFARTSTVFDAASRLLYKVVKAHQFSDGNKRSGVICVYIFAFLNDYMLVPADEVKKLAKKIAKTKGRTNEQMMCRRISDALQEIMKPVLQEKAA